MLSIIVPYRNRKEHLNKFIPHMNSFLKNVEFEINIIEQDGDKPFNRAKLLNVGAVVSDSHSNMLCFHDIDMLPASIECDYSFIKGVCKLSYAVSQFNFVPRPENELGGVTLIDKESFIEVNGYSNNYWGWGVEDNDFALRCKTKNIPFTCRKGKYMSLFHKPNGDTYGDKPSVETIKNREYFNNISKNISNLFDDGFNNVKYELISVTDNQNYKIFKVSI